MTLHLGSTVPLSGDITTLNWIPFGESHRIEENLGFQRGRLAEGYWIALLRVPPRPENFEFAGTTLRSGGRLGLPADDEDADRRRRHVSGEMRADYGDAGYAEMKRRRASTAQVMGPQRLVKILPTIRHQDKMSPAIQYPMGGGGLQWTVSKTRPLPFFIAAYVDGAGRARTLTFEVSVVGGSYDDRAKLARFLQSA